MVGVVGTDIDIRQSNIPHAGRGVFTMRPFNKFDLVTVYEGNTFDSCQEQNFDSTYAINMKGNDVLVGLHDLSDWKNHGVAQLINDPICEFVSDKCVNVHFYEKDKILYARALRDLIENEELYISYGYEYWVHKSRFRKLRLKGISFEEFVHHLKFHLDFDNALDDTRFRNGFPMNCEDHEYYIAFEYRMTDKVECQLSDYCQTDHYRVKFGSVRELICRQCNHSQFANISEDDDNENDNDFLSDQSENDTDVCDVFYYQ